MASVRVVADFGASMGEYAADASIFNLVEYITDEAAAGAGTNHDNHRKLMQHTFNLIAHIAPFLLKRTAIPISSRVL